MHDAARFSFIAHHFYLKRFALRRSIWVILHNIQYTVQSTHTYVATQLPSIPEHVLFSTTVTLNPRIDQ